MLDCSLGDSKQSDDESAHASWMSKLVQIMSEILNGWIYIVQLVVLGTGTTDACSGIESWKWNQLCY